MATLSLNELENLAFSFIGTPEVDIVKDVTQFIGFDTIRFRTMCIKELTRSTIYECVAFYAFKGSALKLKSELTGTNQAKRIKQMSEEGFKLIERLRGLNIYPNMKSARIDATAEELSMFKTIGRIVSVFPQLTAELIHFLGNPIIRDPADLPKYMMSPFGASLVPNVSNRTALINAIKQWNYEFAKRIRVKSTLSDADKQQIDSIVDASYNSALVSDNHRKEMYKAFGGVTGTQEPSSVEVTEFKKKFYKKG
jgi:hypothetical protein